MISFLGGKSYLMNEECFFFGRDEESVERFDEDFAFYERMLRGGTCECQ